MAVPSLTKSQSVLERRPLADAPEHDRFVFSTPADSGRRRSLILSAEDWADLGEPETLTISIEPGDTLNSG